MLLEGKFVLSGLSFMAAVGITAVLVYWAYLPAIVLVGVGLLAVGSLPYIFVGLVRFFRQRRVEKQMLIIVGSALIAVALIAAIAGGALLYVANTTKPGSGTAQSDELNKVRQELQAERDSKAILDSQLATARRELQTAQRQLETRQITAPVLTVEPTGATLFTKKTIRQLRALYEGRTALQAEPFIADEKGKLIDVEGTIVTVYSGIAMLTSLENTGDHIECRFGTSWNAKLSTFRKGEIMKVRGTVAPHQNGAQIYLDNCEIRV